MIDENAPADPTIRAAYEAALESQIEMARMNVESWGVNMKMTPIEQVVLYRLLDRAPWGGLEFKTQQRIGKYVVDFLVNDWTNTKPQIVVECDGHDFHERTKEQAQHDKKRDRELQALGFKVYRFTGSEIWKTRGRCVTEALGLD